MGGWLELKSLSACQSSWPLPASVCKDGINMQLKERNVAQYLTEGEIDGIRETSRILGLSFLTSRSSGDRGHGLMHGIVD